MTDDELAALAIVEPFFLAASQESGRPWPPDPWLGARARAEFAFARADAVEDAALRELVQIAEAFEASLTPEQRALRWRYDRARARAKESVELARAWAAVACCWLRAADDELRIGSPWATWNNGDEDPDL